MFNISTCLPPGRVFFTSDTHFFHDGIIRHADRPFADVGQMNEALICNWNRVVPRNGIVFHLGDFCMGEEEQWNEVLDRLKGEIYLVFGNHDRRMLQHPVMRRFAAMDNEMQVMVGGQELIMNHYPMLVFGGRHTKVWQLFGHVHTIPEGSRILSPDRMDMLLPTQYDVGVDNNMFTPVSFEKLRSIISWQMETGKRYRSW